MNSSWYKTHPKFKWQSIKYKIKYFYYMLWIIDGQTPSEGGVKRAFWGWCGAEFGGVEWKKSGVVDFLEEWCDEGVEG